MNALKKIGNIILIIFGIVLILLCADLLTNKTLNKTYSGLNVTDRQAIEEICTVIDLFDKEDGNPDVWDKVYNPCETGCIIIHDYAAARGYCYVINTTLPANIFSQKIDMPDEYSDINVYRMAMVTPYLLKTFSPSFDEGHIDVNDTSLYAVKYDTSTVKYSGSGSLEESYVKNTFRDAAATPDAPVAQSDVKFVINEENTALTGLQYRIIDELLETDDKNLADELLCEYVLVRDYQASKYPDFAKQQEKTELVKGREQYVYYTVSKLTGNGYTYFDKEISDRITFYSAYHYICTGSYESDVGDYFDEEGGIYTGAALCEIMDKFDIADNWEKKLDNSTNAQFVSQYSLIKDYCKTKDYKDMTLNNIQRAYNYEEVLSMARALTKGNAGEK